MRRRNRNRGEFDEELTRSKERVEARLKEAGISTNRFIFLSHKSKIAHGKRKHEKFEPGHVRGNYGVYTGGGLVGVDIDDYEYDTPVLDELPPTFTVSTPHGGEHRYYRATDRPVTRIRLLTGGAESTTLRWGELYVAGKYLVGPGSLIVNCGKTGCHDCARRNGGSRYTIQEDREIATISSERFGDILSKDPRFDFDGAPPRLLEDFR